MSCASATHRPLIGSSSDGGAAAAHPLPAPRSSSYMMMLNSFASDLDSILSDLSTSPSLQQGSQDMAGLSRISPSPGESSHAASCPNLMLSVGSAPLVKEADRNAQQQSEDVVDSTEIPLLERLIRSHPIWYLPSVQRVAAAQLLQNQEQGVFITRQSSQPGTLALSVKLTPAAMAAQLEAGNRQSTGAVIVGAGVQHYLIEAAENQQGVRLESSDFVFDNLPSLLAHYCQCCDELPVRLQLPAKIRDCSSRSSLTSLALLGQEFWNKGDNILTIPASKRTPPVPPLRLSTFEPLGSVGPSTPIIIQDPADERKSPRLEARGTEPTPPPPPPRWCKPQLIISSPPSSEEATMEDSRKPLEESRPVLRRKRRRQRRKRSASSNSEAPLSPHCHHSALADKSSDYEDIWGTSPGDSHDDEADEEGEDEEETPVDPRPVVLAHEEDTTLSERCCSMSSGRSSISTMEKPTSPAISSPASRSLTSSPEQIVDPIEPEVTIEPPESFQEECKSITIIEIRHSPVPIEENDDCGGPEDKENNVPEPPALVILAEDAMIAVRRRSCSSNESNNNSRNNSRRTSPLYSEPADAIPPNQQPPPSWTKKQQQQLGRPLPQPPASGVTASMDFQTFTKDGYVRCTLPPLPQSSTTPGIHPNRVTVLPSITSSGPMNNRSKQVVMPKPPRQIPTVTVRDPPPAPCAVYLPTATEDDSLTIQEVLTALYPTVSSPSSRTPTPPNSSPIRHGQHQQQMAKQRVSAYDNLLSGSAGDLDDEDEIEAEEGQDHDVSSDEGTVTEFSEPWDSTRWDRLLSSNSPRGSLRAGGTNGRRKRASLIPQSTLNTATASSSSTDAGIGTLSDFETLRTNNELPVISSRPPPVPTLLRARSFKDKMDPLLAAPRLLALRSACNSQAGKNLQVLIIQLGRDCTTTFGRSLQNFLQCTREAKEQRAAPVLRNVRQFISGIKNFLVQHGEPAFDSALLDIRSKLKSNEFLNVDVVLELVLHQLVTLPLRSHLYKLLGQEAVAAGSVQQLLAGIKLAREIHPSSLGLKEGQSPPSTEVLARASSSLDRLQKAASPLDKLEQLLDACAAIYNHAAETCGEAVAAEDFLPLLAWLLAHCGFSTAEMEADFMWALLQPSLLAGEGGYFLTALSSAAQLLKNLQSRPASPSDCGSWMGTLTSIPECAGGVLPQQPCVLKVLVADENQSSLLARTVPLRPSMTVRDVTKLLALKLKLSNPQDFTLVALIDGQEIQLPETENPQTWISSHQVSTASAPLSGNGVSGGERTGCITFAFRRQDAKIAWPRQINA